MTKIIAIGQCFTASYCISENKCRIHFLNNYSENKSGTYFLRHSIYLLLLLLLLQHPVARKPAEGSVTCTTTDSDAANTAMFKGIVTYTDTCLKLLSPVVLLRLSKWAPKPPFLAILNFIETTVLGSVDIISKRRCQALFGHVVRLDATTSAHQALCQVIAMKGRQSLGMNWRRSPGRPRKIWIQQIRNGTPAVSWRQMWQSADERGHHGELSQRTTAVYAS